jgi:hypothetical protein
MSEISSTDVDIFRRLGNPEVVDVNGAGNTTRQITAQMRQAIETAMAARRNDDDDDDDDEPRRPSATVPTSASTPSRLAQAMASAAAAPGERASAAPAAPSSPPPPPRPVQQQQQQQRRPAPEPSEAGSDDGDAAAAPQSKDAEQIRLEKQGYLIELQALERKGVTLSRTFSMRDSVTELEFEVQKQQSALSTANAVSFMRDSLRMAFNGIEIANSRLGPFLSIEGWAESMTSDMKRFDNALERLYKRYWRKQQMSPLMELAWIILGSLAAHHFKQKLFGPHVRPVHVAAGPSPQPRGQPKAQPTLRRGTPAQPAAPPTAFEKARPAVRPVLRPPTALFG